MSGRGFYVHGAHDHEVEHQAQHGPGLAQSVAIFTSLRLLVVLAVRGEVNALAACAQLSR